jgi:serine protease Do
MPERGAALRARIAVVLAMVGALVVATVGEAAPRWGWLGVRIRDLTEREMEEISVKQGLREGFGVVIADVLPDTPAAASSLRAGDVVVAIDGRPVVETRELQRLVGGAPAGRELRVVILRPDGRREVRIRVGVMPPDVVAERVAAEFGFVVREPGTEEGAGVRTLRPPVVSVVAEGTPAARGGLEVGDLILAVEGAEVLSLEDLRRRLPDLALERPLRLRVERKGEPRLLELPPAQPVLPVR